MMPYKEKLQEFAEYELKQQAPSVNKGNPKGHHLCPCGSGKKYKKCCKPKGVEYPS